MGTPGFAVGALSALVDGGYNVVGVVTTPDRQSGRGRQFTKCAVAQYVEKCNEQSQKQITLLQPEKLRDQQFIGSLSALNAELFIVVAFRMLPQVVWAMPKLGTFNLHASLLPNYRGAAPINWAIMNGETKTGVTTFFLNEKIDCGAVIDQVEVDILPTDNAETLHDKLLEVGSALILDSVDRIARGGLKLVAQPQSEAEGRAAPKIFKEHCELTFNCSATEAHNKVRGLSPYPAAWCEISNAQMPQGTSKESVTAKIFITHTELDIEIDSANSPLSDSIEVAVAEWQTDSKTYLRVRTTDGWLYIDELQPQNKKRMATIDFLRGWRS